MIKTLLNMIVLLSIVALLVPIQSDAAQEAGNPEVVPEQKQGAVQQYLNRLNVEKRLTLHINDPNNFHKSSGSLLDKIVASLPQYYRLDQSAQKLVPVQPRMYFTYGDYTGNSELPVIPFSENPAPVEFKVNIINMVLPEYQNEDHNMKVTYHDSNIWVVNKTSKSLKLDKLVLFYNGKYINEILERQLMVAPASSTSAISLAKILDRDPVLFARHDELTAMETQRKKINAGFGTIYRDPQTNTPLMLNRVNTYSVSETVPNMAATTLLDTYMTSLTKDKVIPSVELPLDLKIEFDTGKAEIRKNYVTILNKLGAAMKTHLNSRGIIEGHTDNVGSEAANLNLSERRALAVKQYLMRNYGIDPDRLQTKGFGRSRPIADNGTPVGRAQNRRIEVRFIGV